MKRLIIVLVAVSIGFCVGYAVHQQPTTAKIESTMPSIQTAQESATR